MARRIARAEGKESAGLDGWRMEAVGCCRRRSALMWRDGYCKGNQEKAKKG